MASARVAVVEQQLVTLMHVFEDRMKAEEKAVQLAFNAAEKNTLIAQQTADRAVARAEAAATKEYLENQLTSVRDALVAQINAQDKAITAALAAAKDSLTAALAASDKAIHKQENTISDRFESVNGFREQLNDQAKQFLPKSEGELRFTSVERRLEDVALWRRTIDLKFAEYVTSDLYHRTMLELTSWRRTVDAALTAAQSKSGLIYAIMAMAIAAGGLLIAIFNLFSKAPVVR